MEVSSTRPRAIGRGRGRPAQALYMPPARRHREPTVSTCEEIPTENKEGDSQIMDETIMSSAQVLEKLVDLTISDNSIKDITNQCIKSAKSETDSIGNMHISEKKEAEMYRVITQVENNKPSLEVVIKEKPVKREEVKVKTRNAKLMDVKCDVLQISLAKNVKKSPIKLVQVDQWEDLVHSDEDHGSPDAVQKHKAVITKYDDNDGDEFENLSNDQLEHIVEIYDFPSTFKTPDVMQIYNEMDQDSMYIKWLSDTRALLVLGSAMQAKRALGIENPFVKSRPVALGSSIALEAVRTSNLRPAMKRPQTSMQAARRMITTALGAKSTVSREVQQRERDALKKAKEERRTQRQNERDAWEGNPRPTTA